MASLMELLPLIVDGKGNPYGWAADFRYEFYRALEPGRELHLGPWRKPGWMRSAILLSNNPHVRVSQTVFHGQRPVSWSFYEAWLYGMTSPGPIGLAWVPKYDAANNIYSMLYQPVPPQEFMAGADIWFSLPETDPTGAPITAPATISYSVHVIVLDSREKLIEKLREILSAK
jgi:hypothetical protein